MDRRRGAGSVAASVWLRRSGKIEAQPGAGNVIAGSVAHEPGCSPHRMSVRSGRSKHLLDTAQQIAARRLMASSELRLDQAAVADGRG